MSRTSRATLAPSDATPESAAAPRAAEPRVGLKFPLRVMSRRSPRRSANADRWAGAFRFEHLANSVRRRLAADRRTATTARTGVRARLFMVTRRAPNLRADCVQTTGKAPASAVGRRSRRRNRKPVQARRRGPQSSRKSEPSVAVPRSCGEYRLIDAKISCRRRYPLDVAEGWGDEMKKVTLSVTAFAAGALAFPLQPASAQNMSAVGAGHFFGGPGGSGTIQGGFLNPGDVHGVVLSPGGNPGVHGVVLNPGGNPGGVHGVVLNPGVHGVIAKPGG
jgi:hypothetical protein